MSKEKNDQSFDLQHIMAAIEAHGWHAYPENMPPAEHIWPSREAVITRLKTRLGCFLHENLPDILTHGETRKEQLLELCMVLFEGMNVYRGGLLRMMDLTIKRPTSPLSILCGLNQVLDEGLAAMGIGQDSILGTLRYHGVHVIFSMACHSWCTDNTNSLEKTHLFLDQQLSKGAAFMARYDAA